MGPTLATPAAKISETPATKHKPAPLFLEPELTKAEGDRAAATKQRERRKTPASALKMKKSTTKPATTTRATKRAATAGDDLTGPAKTKRTTFTG